MTTSLDPVQRLRLRRLARPLETAGPDVRANIYFVLAPLVGRVKIGKTTNLFKRVGALRAACPITLELVAYEVAHPSMEYVYHRRFEEWRRAGEWFDRGDDLDALITDLQARFPLPDWASSQ